MKFSKRISVLLLSGPLFTATCVMAQSSVPFQNTLGANPGPPFEDGALAAIPMELPDGSLSGVCVVGVSPEYDFDYYLPNPRRLDLKLVTRDQRPETTAWLTPRDLGATGPPIYTVAGTIGNDSWVEFVSLNSDNPEEFEHHLSPMDNPVVQIASDPEEPVLWVHQDLSQNPPRFRLTSYDIDPQAPSLDASNILVDMEMEGVLQTGSLVATRFGKLFGVITDATDIEAANWAMIAAGFSTAVSATNPIPGSTFIGLTDAIAVGDEAGSAIYSFGVLQPEISTYSLLVIDESAPTVSDATEVHLSIDNPNGVVISVSGSYIHNSESIVYLPTILKQKLVGQETLIDINQVANLFSEDPGEINNISLSSDGSTIGVMTDSNQVSGDGPTFFHIDASDPTRINRPNVGNDIFYYELPGGFLNGEPLEYFGLQLTGNTATVVGDNTGNPDEPARMVVIGYKTPAGFSDSTVVSFKLTDLEGQSPLETLTPTEVGPTETVIPTNPATEVPPTPTATDTPLPVEPEVSIPIGVSLGLDLSDEPLVGDFAAVPMTDVEGTSAGVCVVKVTPTWDPDWYSQIPPASGGLPLPNPFRLDLPIPLINLVPGGFTLTDFDPSSDDTPELYVAGGVSGGSLSAVARLGIESNLTTGDLTEGETNLDFNEFDIDSSISSQSSLTDTANDSIFITETESDLNLRIRAIDNTSTTPFLETATWSFSPGGQIQKVETVALNDEIAVTAVQHTGSIGEEINLVASNINFPDLSVTVINEGNVAAVAFDGSAFAEDSGEITIGFDLAITYTGLEKTLIPGNAVFEHILFDDTARTVTDRTQIDLPGNPIEKGTVVTTNDVGDPEFRKVFVALDNNMVFVYDIPSKASKQLDVNGFASQFGLTLGDINGMTRSPDGKSVGFVTKGNEATGDPPTIAIIDSENAELLMENFYELEDAGGAPLLNGDPVECDGLAMTDNTAVVVGDNTGDPDGGPRLAVIGYNLSAEFEGEEMVSVPLTAFDETIPTPTPPGETLTPTPPGETPTATSMFAKHPEFDVNGNGKIDADDLIWFMNDWMKPVQK